MAALAIGALLAGSTPARAADGALRDALRFAAAQAARTADTLPPDRYPEITDRAGRWRTTGARAWTSGFLAGQLWLLYERTGDPAWKARAQRWQAGLEAQKGNTSTHDLGFMLFDSFGNGYRLTRDDRYRRIVLDAARSLATRYDPDVGWIRSWGSRAEPTFRVIVDNMMNLELLFWASRHGGEPDWRRMAIRHALRSRAEHVRSDGSTRHLVEADPETGAIVRKRTVQGYADDSTWARGQAWAIHGFAMTYRETRDVRFLGTARRVAEWYLDRLPADRVPYWDFDAPNVPDEPRDSSAAAIAAAGLLELAELDPSRKRRRAYHRAALGTLRSLARDYLADGTANHAVLLHGTQHKPRGNYDTGTIWGDYYFVEALNRAARGSRR